MSSYSIDAEFEKARQYYNLYSEGPEVRCTVIRLLGVA